MPKYRVYNVSIMAKQNLFQIGVIAERANVNIQTLRYYEKRNILKPARVKESGYRLYTEDAVKTVTFVKHAQELGFKLDEIKQLLGLRNASVNRCDSVRKRAQIRLSDVQEKMKMLKRIEKTLKVLIKDCENNKTSKKCPIIDSLEAKT